MEQTRALGAIPSPEDYRDRIATASVYEQMMADAAAGTLPLSFLTDIAALAVMDQNKIPSCVSHAWALMMKYWWWKKTGEIVDFSPRFLDIISGQIDSWIPLDGGRVPRTVCKVSATLGCCTEKLLPNDTVGLTLAQYRDPKAITQEMKDEAAKYKIPGYIRIKDDTIADFRNAIMRFGLVSGLFTISDAFWTPSWNKKDINPLRPKLTDLGHQMVVNGWNGDLNHLRNEWSKDWNDNGEGDYNAKDWLQFVWEGWTIAELPADLKSFMSSLPSQYDFHYVWKSDMKQGDHSEDVKMMQIAYMILGLMAPVAPEDLGYFGPKTAKANLAYQNRKRITPSASGSAGPKTRAALNMDFAL